MSFHSKRGNTRGENLALFFYGTPLSGLLLGCSVKLIEQEDVTNTALAGGTGGFMASLAVYGWVKFHKMGEVPSSTRS